MKIELFFTPGCEHCTASRGRLKAAAAEVAGDVDWREIDITVEIDYAVEKGVLCAPALAIDGELAFSSLPTERQLRVELGRRMKGR